MAHNPHIDELGPAIGEHYIGKSNASGIQEYKLMDPDYFLHGADIKNKSMSFYNDEEGTDKPGVHNSPLNPPSDPALNATLEELFDDYRVYWRWNGATWSKLTEEFRYEFIQLNYSAQGTAAINGTAVVHSFMNGWKLVRICVYNNGGTNIAGGLPIVLLNNVAWGPNQGVGANASNCVNDPTFSAVTAGDFLKIDPTRMPAAPVDFAMTLAFKRP